MNTIIQKIQIPLFCLHGIRAGLALLFDICLNSVTLLIFPSKHMRNLLRPHELRLFDKFSRKIDEKLLSCCSLHN
jgi:hypothetical protein